MFRTTAVRGGSEKLFAVSLLQIGGTDTRREQKLTAGTVKNVRPVHFLPTCLLRNHAAAYNHGHPCPF